MSDENEQDNGRRPGSGGAPSRTYRVFEEQHFDEDNAPYFVEIGTVEARNATNALRKAYRDLKGGEEGDCVLSAVPESYWRPTPVAGKRRADITVSVG